MCPLLFLCSHLDPRNTFHSPKNPTTSPLPKAISTRKTTRAPQQHVSFSCHCECAWCAASLQSIPTLPLRISWRGQSTAPVHASTAWQLDPADNLDKLGAYPQSWRARQGEDKQCRNLQPVPNWREAENEILIWKELSSGSGSEEHPAGLPICSPSPRAEWGGRERTMNTDLFLWTEGCHMPCGSGGPRLGWFLGPAATESKKWTFLSGGIPVTRAGDGQMAPKLFIQEEGGRNTTGLATAGSKPTSLCTSACAPKGRSNFQRGRQVTWQQDFTIWDQ